MEDKKIGKGMKWGYAFGGVGKDMCYALVANFLMYYATENLGVSAVFMGVLFFFARLWDAINDPIMGTFVDNTNIKFGRYRFWILIGTLANAVAVFLLFNPYLAMKSGSASAYIAVFYVIWGMTYTMVDVPFWSFNSNITDDRKERESVATLARIFASAGNLGTQILTVSMVIRLGRDTLGKLHPENGYFKWASIVAIAFIATISVTVLSIKERNVSHHLGKQHITFKESFTILVKNDQLMAAVVTFILLNIGQNCAMGVALYYFKYVWGSDKLYSTFAVMLGASVGIGLLGFPLLSKLFYKRSGRHGLFLFSTILPAIGFVLIFISNNFIMKSAGADARFKVFCIIAVIFFIGFGSLNILLTLFMADCVDYGEYKFGKRTENIVFSMQTFLVKFATALSGIITGIGLTAGGYKGNSFTNSAVAMKVVPQSLKLSLNIMMFVLPPLFIVIGIIIFSSKFNLDRKGKMEEIQQALFERRAAQARENGEIQNDAEND